MFLACPQLLLQCPTEGEADGNDASQWPDCLPLAVKAVVPLREPLQMALTKALCALEQSWT